MMETLIGASPAGGAADVIKDITAAEFEKEVLQTSMDTPVIVDFWAPWCGPCKQLGPALEKVVKAQRGKIRMVKVNVDENQDLAAAMRVQSIPTVYAFAGGRPVDGFASALPESQIQQFVERVLQAAGVGPSAAEQGLDQAEAALQEGNHATAAQIFGQVLSQEPDNVQAMGGMIKCFIALGDTGRARQALDQVPADLADKPEIQAARTALDLAEQGGGDVSALRVKVEADPDDHQARYDLANALYAGGQVEDAIDHLLELFRRDRAWNEDAARKQLVKIFEALGHSHPLTVASRRRLSSLMFV